MKKVLLTGGTGLIGYNIAEQLLADNREVAVLVRSKSAAQDRVPVGCELVEGDICNLESLRPALQDCSVVYHAAGIPEGWLADTSRFETVNTNGTANVAQAARESGVEKFIYISTVDVFEARSGECYGEQDLAVEPKGTPYERSKQDADREMLYHCWEGLPVVFVHPAAVYGPGPSDALDRGLNTFIAKLRSGQVPVVPPGGLPVVYSRDVARGACLAEQNGRPGERFILSESYLELCEFAELVCRVLGSIRVPGVIPLWLAQTISNMTELLAKVTKIPPLIPHGQLHLLQWGAIPDNSHAKKRLGWEPMAVDQGIKEFCEMNVGSN